MCSVLLLFLFCFFVKLALANEKPITCYFVAPVRLELHFQIGPDCYVGSAILRLHKRQDTTGSGSFDNYF